MMGLLGVVGLTMNVFSAVFNWHIAAKYNRPMNWFVAGASSGAAVLMAAVLIGG